MPIIINKKENSFKNGEHDFFAIAEKAVKNKKGVYESLLIVFLALIIFLVGYFYKSCVFDLNDALIDLDARMVAEQDRLSKYEKVNELALKFGDLSKNISIMLPTKKDWPEIFVFLENSAKKNGLNLNSLEVSESTNVQAGAKYAKAYATVALSGGDYFLVKNFLRELEMAGRFVDISAITYRPEQKSYNLKMALYYLVE